MTSSQGPHRAAREPRLGERRVQRHELLARVFGDRGGKREGDGEVGRELVGRVGAPAAMSVPGLCSSGASVTS